MSPRKKEKAITALMDEKRVNENFGPLIDHENSFSVLGLEITGLELIGRLWKFALQLPEPESTNAKCGMITALSDSFNPDESRVCNQGKTQRLVIAVLSGRLLGVNIDEVPVRVTKEQAMQMFFNIPAHRQIISKAALIDFANQFCNQNAAINRDEFLTEINAYAAQSGIV